MRQLMDWIDKHKRAEDDQQRGKGKAKVAPLEWRDFRYERYNNNQPRRDFIGHTELPTAQVASTVFKEPMHQILAKIKVKPYSKWPNKMGVVPTRCNQGLYCQYHQDCGHIIEECRTLRDYLEQLVKIEKLRQFLHQPSRQGSQTSSTYQRESSSRLSLGTISVILEALSRIGACPSRVMSIARPCTKDSILEFKRGRIKVRPTLSFSNDDKAGTVQPHDVALEVTLQIWGYDVKRVLVDQGSSAKIMHPDLYKGLNLKPKDLVSYDSPLVGFDGKTVILKGLIRLPVQARSEVVEVNFIVMDAYSPYTAILARPWLHAIRVVSSTLHLMVKYPSGDQVGELIGSQAMARQCQFVVIKHQSKDESSATLERAL